MSSNVGPQRVLSLVNQTADETIGIPFDCSGYIYVTAYLIGTGTLDSGVVTFEEADFDLLREPAFTGTWSSISTANAVDVTGGAQKAIHFAAAAYHWVRPRISTVIAGAGGSISVVFVGSSTS